MTRNTLMYSCFGWLLAGFLLACGPNEELPGRQELIQQALDKKIQKYEQTHANRCRKTVLEKAKTIVDSTMLANARNVLVVDSLPRPPKPVKPELPVPKALEDTLEIAPLLPIEQEVASPLR